MGMVNDRNGKNEQRQKKLEEGARLHRSLVQRKILMTQVTMRV